MPRVQAFQHSTPQHTPPPNATLKAIFTHQRRLPLTADRERGIQEGWPFRGGVLGLRLGYMLKIDPTAKSTIDCLTPITDKLITPNMFMANGGTYFNHSQAVHEFCEERGICHLTIPAYAPWNNGLLEGLNCLLLGRLCRLCSPNRTSQLTQTHHT